MRTLVRIAVLAALVAYGCLLRHVTKEIPPPGGCDQCHRYTIAGRWEVSLAPVPLGREGGIPEDTDIILRELRDAPVHRAVPTRRLEVFAAAAPPEAVGDAETGIQCFVCHRSPGPPHRELRGTFPHPWGRGRDGHAGE
ncbi:MAG: hypothetical protein SCH98_03330 [Deferrisomatales bacterium]|nr:hypothetical protein [Deferrisomatales bacterium]